MRFAIASGDVSTAAAPCGLLKFTAPMSHGMMISSAYEPPGYHANRRTEPQSAIAIAFRYGGRVDASAHCV